jgi:hypothetical protein
MLRPLCHHCSRRPTSHDIAAPMMNPPAMVATAAIIDQPSFAARPGSVAGPAASPITVESGNAGPVNCIRSFGKSDE